MKQSKWGNEFGGYMGEFDGYDPLIPKDGFSRYYITYDRNDDLPNIMLMGDSILNKNIGVKIRQYFTGIANVNRIQHPFPEYYVHEYLDNFWNFEKWNYDVIYYMSGLHGFLPRQNDQQCIEGTLDLINKCKTRNIKLIWGNMTSIPKNFKSGGTATAKGPSQRSMPCNDMSIHRNNLLKPILEDAGISILDQYNLMSKVPHVSDDDCHFVGVGDKILADGISKMIGNELSKLK